jgi:hypothetical protein
MHLSDADLGAALDPAGGGATGTAARAHATACDPCADALRAARTMDRQVAEMLALLDHPAPIADRQSLKQRIAQSDRARQGQARGSALTLEPSSRRSPTLVVEHGARERARADSVKVAARRSAVILVLGAAVAAAAVPRSPVRAFLSRIVASPVRHAPPPAPVTPSAPTAQPPATPRGVAITSADYVDLVFQNPQTSGELRIHPTLGTHVSVTASADGPTYTVGSASILVESHDVPDVVYDIDLPPAARVRSVTIRVGDQIVFSRRGTAVQTAGSIQADGGYVVRLGH